MKIAILSTPWIAVPPFGYGGIELVVAHLAEGLVKRGHEVLLFATGDSTSTAKLSYYYEKALGNNLFLKNNPYHLLLHTHAFVDIVRREQFDIVHNNAQYIPQYLLDVQPTPVITTLHGAFYKELDAPTGFNVQKRQTLMHFKKHNYVSISDNQRTGMPELNYIKTVYNGIFAEEFELGEGKGDYLAWFGRVTPNKGLDTAIKVAKKAGMKLKVAAFIDAGDQQYFDTEIKPLLDPSIEFIGELTDKKVKADFLKNAKALLFPIRWHEPFGLVMIEAMASGTPVIGFNQGSVGEVVVHGKTGFVVETEDEMIEAIGKANTIDRSYCRQHVVDKFTVDQMVEGYLEAYNKVLGVRG